MRQIHRRLFFFSYVTLSCPSIVTPPCLLLARLHYTCNTRVCAHCSVEACAVGVFISHMTILYIVLFVFGFFSNHFVSSSLDSTHVYNHLHRAHSIQAPCLLLCTLFAQQLSMTVTISTDGLVLLLELSMHLCHRRCAFVLLVCVTSSFVYCRRQLCCILSPQSRCSTGYKVSLRYTFFD